MQKHQWKDKVQEIFNVCQEELKRTTEIGMKMLSASKTNSELHETFEELGRLAASEINEGKLQWDSPQVKELMEKIESCKKDLETIGR